MEVWAGAHVHTFIEWDEPVLLACSGGASSTKLLGRWRMYDAENILHVQLPKADHRWPATRKQHDESDHPSSPHTMVDVAALRSPALKCMVTPNLKATSRGM